MALSYRGQVGKTSTIWGVNNGPFSEAKLGDIRFRDIYGDPPASGEPQLPELEVEGLDEEVICEKKKKREDEETELAEIWEAARDAGGSKARDQKAHGAGQFLKRITMIHKGAQRACAVSLYSATSEREVLNSDEASPGLRHHTQRRAGLPSTASNQCGVRRIQGRKEEQWAFG